MQEVSWESGWTSASIRYSAHSSIYSPFVTAPPPAINSILTNLLSNSSRSLPKYSVSSLERLFFSVFLSSASWITPSYAKFAARIFKWTTYFPTMLMYLLTNSVVPRVVLHDRQQHDHLLGAKFLRVWVRWAWNSDHCSSQVKWFLLQSDFRKQRRIFRAFVRLRLL